MLRCAALLPLVLPAAASRAQEEPTFDCQIYLSVDLAGAERWGWARSEGFELAPAREVVRGQHFLVYPFFTRFARDGQGRCAIDLDLEVTAPDGSTYHEDSRLEALRLDPGPRTLLLAEELVGVAFEPGDALGTYRVEVEAHDRVTGKRSRSEQALQLVEYAEGEGFDDPEAVWSWAWTYYNGPEPRRAAPALRTLAPQGLAEITTLHGALVELLSWNEWLFPHLFARWPEESAETRALVLWLLARTGTEAEPFLTRLGAEERSAYEGFRARPNPLEDPISGRADLNELLGRYALGRARAPLLRLVLALAPEETGVVAGHTVRDASSGLDVPITKVVPIFLARSLPRYLDGVTRGYLEVMRTDERIPAAARTVLERILEEGGRDEHPGGDER